MSLKQMQFLDGASTGKQEPVRIMGFDCVCGRRMVVSAEQGVVQAPQRTWVGLTDEEIQECYNDAYKIVQGRRLENAFYKTIEAKLKQKNGYAEEKNT
jgi:hypothetical protein